MKRKIDHNFPPLRFNTEDLTLNNPGRLVYYAGNHNPETLRQIVLAVDANDPLAAFGSMGGAQSMIVMIYADGSISMINRGNLDPYTEAQGLSEPEALLAYLIDEEESEAMFEAEDATPAVNQGGFDRQKLHRPLPHEVDFNPRLLRYFKGRLFAYGKLSKSEVQGALQLVDRMTHDAIVRQPHMRHTPGVPFALLDLRDDEEIGLKLIDPREVAALRKGYGCTIREALAFIADHNPAEDEDWTPAPNTMN